MNYAFRTDECLSFRLIFHTGFSDSLLKSPLVPSQQVGRCSVCSSAGRFAGNLFSRLHYQFTIYPVLRKAVSKQKNTEVPHKLPPMFATLCSLMAADVVGGFNWSYDSSF